MIWSQRMDFELLRRIFPGDSEIASRLRGLDWSASELGTPDTWPQSLQTAVAICLASRVPMQVWWGQQRVLIYNDAAIQLFGDRHPSVLARSGRASFSDDVWNAIGPALERAFDTATTVWCEGVRMILPRKLASEEVFMTFSFAPIPGEDGVQGVFGAAIDVTENVLATRRLSTLHRLAIAVASARSVETATNTLAQVLHGSADIPFATLYPIEGTLAWIERGEAKPAAPGTIDAAVIARVLEGEESVELDMGGRHALALPLRGPEGVTGILVCGLSPLLPLDDVYRSFLELVAAHVSSTLADIAEPERSHPPSHTTVPQLGNKDGFLSVVAHELRNPLSALMTTLQTLMMRTPSDEVALMERSVRQLSRIVDNLLDVSRIARGRLELRPRPTELATIVDRAMELVTPLVTARNTQVFVRVPRVGLQLDADPDRIAQALANLLANAARYSDPGSRVWIQATREYEKLRLVVKDEGCGIESDRLAVVFEAFYQPPETRPRTAGLGLGLAIARSLIELHGGSLRVTSAGTGRGTECLVELPTSTRLIATAPVSTAPASRRRLLLVEDNDDTARALKNGLEQLGYIVALAHNGPIALNVARTFDPDVVLMDIGLPVMDGWELANRLRELRGATHNAPVVAVTAYDRDVDKQRSADAGFADHLIKPIDLSKLQAVVEGLPLRQS
jgi:signal transduction histidine kinase